MNTQDILYSIIKNLNINIAKIIGVLKKNELKKDVFWDDFEMNAIKVYSEKEINKQQAKTLKELGIVY